jgi:hypothetical protein
VIGEIAGWNDAGPGELRGQGTCWLEFRAFYLRATLAIFFWIWVVAGVCAVKWVRFQVESAGGRFED